MKTDFPLSNLPYGVFKPKNGEARIGVALGDKVIDLRALSKDGLLPQCGLDEATLNTFMGSGSQTWREVREELQKVLLSDESSKNIGTVKGGTLLQSAVFEQKDVEMLLPAHIGDYTDFYASREHATNVGTMFRSKDNPLLPNWLHIPVGYHGRASSVVASGTPLRRPRGQMVAKDTPDGPPTFGPSKLLDIELEMGAFVGKGNALGEPITLDNADEHIFGLVLLNDWSARDIQKWEYVPLGPFLGKNFGSTISPWVVPLDALKNARVETPAQDAPKPLPYLQQGPGAKHGFDIELEVLLQTAEMDAPESVINSNIKYMYWSLAQQLTHHTVNGCPMRPGDLLGTGTISGPTENSFGSFLETTWGGQKEMSLKGGAIKRKFLQDGDRVIMRGVCRGPDGERIGFGDCDGVILPAIE